MDNEIATKGKDKTKKKRTKARFIFGGIAVIIIGFIIAGLCDTKLTVTNYVYHNTKLPKEFDGYKIVLISDLHHKNFGKNQSELIGKISAQRPDAIVLTGDIVDKRHIDMKSTEDFIKGISTISPVYYVDGNHEHSVDAANQYERLLALMSEYGIMNLNDKSIEIRGEQASIFFTGVPYCGDNIVNRLRHADESVFNILLYHCSDAFDKISSYGYDIVLSGHAHGGIVRLPFVGGVFGNNRELFPKYDGGVYIENNCTMFSSRGLGDADIPRFYNPPEIVVITLRCE